MLDKYKRKINYLRISVTDRCNLRCTYCMPAEGVELMKHENILRFDEIIATVKYAANQGVNKIRLTGGEPLVKKGIVELVSMLSQIDGITDFGMTTNGVFLNKYDKQLKEAGLHRVNISLDTIDPKQFKAITRVGNIEDVFNGIKAAKNAGLTPIKINCVIKKSHNEPDAVEVAKFCKENDLQIRYIHEMNLEKGDFSIVEGGTGGHCAICNRLRLTANGDIMPCLFSNLKFNVRKLGIEEAFAQALGKKPKSGHVQTSSKFYNIGG